MDAKQIAPAMDVHNQILRDFTVRQARELRKKKRRESKKPKPKHKTVQLSLFGGNKIIKKYWR